MHAKHEWVNINVENGLLEAAVGLSIELASLKDLAISNAAGMKNLAELVDSIKLDDIMALLDALTREAKGILVQAELQVNARKELLDEMRVTAEAIRKHNEDSADADLILKAANVAGGVAVFFPPVGTVIGAATTVTSLALQEVKDNAVSKLDAAAIERMDTKMVADNLHGMTIAQHLQAVSYLQMTLLASTSQCCSRLSRLQCKKVFSPRSRSAVSSAGAHGGRRCIAPSHHGAPGSNTDCV